MFGISLTQNLSFYLFRKKAFSNSRLDGAISTKFPPPDVSFFNF